MGSKNYAQAVRVVMARAAEGFKLSELHGVERAAAKRLIDFGKLHAAPIKGGDFIVTKE